MVRMRRRMRWRPTRQPCRRRWRAICREPYQGVPGCLQELGIDLAHEREIGLALAGRGSVIARACDAEQPALSADREPRVSGLDPAPPPIEAHRPEALDKKIALDHQLA